MVFVPAATRRINNRTTFMSVAFPPQEVSWLLDLQGLTDFPNQEVVYLPVPRYRRDFAC